MDFYVCYSYYDPHDNTYNNNNCNKACVLKRGCGEVLVRSIYLEVGAGSDATPKHYVGFSAYKRDARPRFEIGQKKLRGRLM